MKHVLGKAFPLVPWNSSSLDTVYSTGISIHLSIYLSLDLSTYLLFNILSLSNLDCTILSFLLLSTPKDPAFKSFDVPNSLTICSNRTNFVDLFDKVIDQASTKLAAKAYLHWYYRYGASDSLFSESIETVRKVQEDYKEVLQEKKQ